MAELALKQRLYITSHMRPIVRLHGNLMDLPMEPIAFEASRKLIFSLLSKEQVNRYYSKKYLDFCMDVPGIGRFRTNIFRHFRGIAGIFRVVADTVWPLAKLGLPEVTRKFSTCQQKCVDREYG